MTLIVGILCEDGIAIASDRLATNAAFLPLAHPQPLQTGTQSVTKVTQVGANSLLAVSGSPAIGTEYEAIIKRSQAKFPNASYELATKTLRSEVREAINKHLETAKLLHEAVGTARAYDECTCECLVAANFKDGVRLLQIQRQGAFDLASPEMPIRVIGSGQLQADPFSIFLRKTFWPERLPTVDEGILYAMWAVDYAIEVGAPGVGEGINAYSIRKSGNKTTIGEASDDQVKSNRDFIREAKEQLRKSADVRHATDADAKQIPTIPK